MTSLFFPKRVVIFQETCKIQGREAEVPRDLTAKKRLGWVAAAQNEMPYHPVKPNSQPRIGQVWKVITADNPRKKIAWYPLNLKDVAEVGEILITTTVVEVACLIHEAEEEVSEEEVLALVVEAEVSWLLEEEDLFFAVEEEVFPSHQ